MTQAEQQAAAMKIWAETHGKLADKVLAKKTKQAGRATIKASRGEKRITAGQDISTLGSKFSDKKKPAAKPTSKTNKKKPAAKPTAKPTAPKATKKGDGSVKAIKVQRTGSTEVKKTAKPTKKPAAKPNLKAKTGTARGGSRASNNNRGKVQTSKSKGPKVGETRRIRKGSKYVTQGWTGSRWKAVGGKG
jgi:hypothetical protein